MLRASRYLKQTVTLQRRAGFNGYGEPSFSDPETVKARKVPAFGRTVNDLGVEVPNRTKLLMDVEISVGDLVDGVAIEGVEAVLDRRGRTTLYRVQL